jgi:hypothetical protein
MQDRIITLYSLNTLAERNKDKAEIIEIQVKLSQANRLIRDVLESPFLMTDYQRHYDFCILKNLSLK